VGCKACLCPALEPAGNTFDFEWQATSQVAGMRVQFGCCGMECGTLSSATVPPQWLSC
jgi:hypothetical protein